jgi:uncharacterized protein YkwD
MLNKCKGLIPLKIVTGTFVLIVVLFGTVPSLRNAAVNSLSAIYGAVLVNLANQDRVKANLAELKVNPILEKAAQMKADDMAAKSYFAHNTPDGKTPWYWFKEAGYEYSVAGENLAVNFQDSGEVHQAWVNSRGHFLNIINPRFTEIGIATSSGTYKGRSAVFVVQLFGNPAK